MNLEKLNDWLTLLANVGVVVGLVAVLLELRHSSQVAEVAAYQTRMAEIQEINLELALSDDLASILVKFDEEGVAGLSAEERLRTRAWYQHILRQMQGQYYQYQNGFLERSVIDTTLDDIANGIYQNWEHLGLLGAIEIPEWRDEIEKALTEEH